MKRIPGTRTVLMDKEWRWDAATGRHYPVLPEIVHETHALILSSTSPSRIERDLATVSEPVFRESDTHRWRTACFIIRPEVVLPIEFDTDDPDACEFCTTSLLVLHDDPAEWERRSQIRSFRRDIGQWPEHRGGRR